MISNKQSLNDYPAHSSNHTNHLMLLFLALLVKQRFSYRLSIRLVYDLTLHKCLTDWKFPFLQCVNFYSCFFICILMNRLHFNNKINEQISATGTPDSWLPVNHWELKYQYLSYQPDNVDNISEQTKQFH